MNNYNPNSILPQTEALLHFFEKCRLVAYQDSGGIWTIGYGDTYHQDGTPVKEGDTCTQAEADQRFKEDFSVRKAQVLKLIKVPLTEHQIEALVSLTYNIGINNLKTSDLLAKLNRHDLFGAVEQFKWWRKAGGVVQSGLIRRRLSEVKLFCGDPNAIVAHEEFKKMDWQAWYK